MKKWIAALGAVATVATVIPSTPTSAAPTTPTTIAGILTADGDQFDRNWHDFDVLTEAVLLFPDLVAAASDPSANLTVFAPTDAAFRKLAKKVTGHTPRTEKATFEAIAGLGADTVKTFLTYHIIGTKISAADALASDGAQLTTLQGGILGVDVEHNRIKLVDLDPNSRNPRVTSPEVGGVLANGYIHAIDRVLRPIDL
jgi:uncharacterized surface protein with fasciclin (FAS1) repeats